jgi:hypothetical protein
LTPGSLATLAACCLFINYGGAVLAGLFQAVPHTAEAAPRGQNENRRLVASREEAVRRLNAVHGMHLVFVRYARGFSTHQEWVFNSGDLESQRVIFAQDLGEARNLELMARYPSRNSWLCSMTIRDKHLEPYPSATDLAQSGEPAAERRGTP